MSEPRQSIFVLNDAETMKPAVRIEFWSGRDPDSGLCYFHIPNTIRVSCYDTEEGAVDGGWSAIDTCVNLILSLGIRPNNEMVLGVLKTIVSCHEKVK